MHKRQIPPKLERSSQFPLEGEGPQNCYKSLEVADCRCIGFSFSEVPEATNTKNCFPGIVRVLNNSCWRQCQIVQNREVVVFLRCVVVLLCFTLSRFGTRKGSMAPRKASLTDHGSLVALTSFVSAGDLSSLQHAHVERSMLFFSKYCVTFSKPDAIEVACDV